MPTEVVSALNLVISVIIILVFVEVIIANLLAFGSGISPYSPAVRTLRKIVNPMLDPFRRLLPAWRTGGWDFSPVLLMLLLYLVRNMLSRMH